MSWRGDNLDCERCVDAAPYVLGALADPEPYRVHVARCATCQAEVAELQLVVDALPTTVAPVVAPESVRERVLATVRSEAERLGAGGQPSGALRRPAGRRRSRRGTVMAASLAIAASAAIAAAIVAIALSGGSSVREQVSTGRIAARIQGAHASLHQTGDRAELVLSGMPEPPPGRIYEVWLSRGTGSPEPTDALFSVTSRGSGAVAVPNVLHGVKEVLVTSEPLGGSSHPTSPPLIRITIRS
jgi:hypothetical protein